MRIPLVRFFFALVMTSSLLVMAVAQQVGQTRTIEELNTVSQDSLNLMQSLGTAARAGMDDTPFAIRSDTVRVTGIVLVRPRVLTYTLARYNIFIQDTGTGKIFAGLNVLTNDTSTAAQNTGITALDSGDVVTVTGRALEFPQTGQQNSLTEMYLYNPSGTAAFTTPVPVEVGASLPRPLPLEMTVDSFSLGTTPRISVGEHYEGMYVVIRNVTVNSIDPASGRFTFLDSHGNQMGMYDGSGYYTLRGHKISGSKYAPPPVGTQLGYIRGVILPQPRTGTAGEYTIMPLYPGSGQLTGSVYPGDIKIDKFAPSISGITRVPQVPKSTDTVVVKFVVKDLNSAGGADSAFFSYRNATGGAWTRKPAAKISGDTLFQGKIPPFANNTYVSYFVEAYTSGSSYGSSPDSTIPLFYAIRDGGLSIFDVQFTPYVNGRSGFVDDTVTVSGIISTDTTDYKELVSGRPVMFAQSAKGPWNGVALYGKTAGVGMDTLVRGDNVAVTGIVLETNSRTIIQVLSRNVNGRGAAIPADTAVSMSGAGSLSYELSNPPVSGSAAFEKWEGVLISVTNVYLINRNADNLADGASSNFGEYFISQTAPTSTNSRFGIRVDDNGTNWFYADTASTYTAKPANAVLIPKGSKISFLRGILDFSFSFYKLEPRKNDDFGVITGVTREEGIVPTRFTLDQNYPNPFNPSTTIRYTLPAASRVTLKVFNLLGQEVRTLVQQDQGVGAYVVTFDAAHLSTGVYFYQLQANENIVVKKMMFVK